MNTEEYMRGQVYAMVDGARVLLKIAFERAEDNDEVLSCHVGSQLDAAARALEQVLMELGPAVNDWKPT